MPYFVKGCNKENRVRQVAEKSLATSVKHVLSPFFVLMSNQAHQLPRRMQSKRTRTASQSQSGLFGRAVPLAIVAGVTASHKIFPGRAAAARARYHVV